MTSPTPGTPLATRAAHEMVALVGRLRRQFQSMTSDTDLTPPQAALILRLAKHGPGSVTELAAAEGMKSQSMVTIVSAVESQGFVQRTRDPNDGRRWFVSLTAAGERRATEDRAARERWLVEIFDRCTTEQLQIFLEVLASVDQSTQRSSS